MMDIEEKVFDIDGLENKIGECEHIAEMKDENELLKDYIDNIASIIYYQMPLKEQDLWVDDVVAMGWYKKPSEEEDE